MIIYLYVKQHSETGLLYFGKTTKPDPYKYKGSGVYWRRHINKHGSDCVVTKHVWAFDDQDDATAFALKFSIENQIVESKDWANMINEDAIGYGTPGRKLGNETKQKISEAKKGKPSNRRGSFQTEESKMKMSKSKIGKPRSPTTKAKISSALIGRKLSPETIAKRTASRKRKAHPSRY